MCQGEEVWSYLFVVQKDFCAFFNMSSLTFGTISAIISPLYDINIVTIAIVIVVTVIVVVLIVVIVSLSSFHPEDIWVGFPRHI